MGAFRQGKVDYGFDLQKAVVASHAKLVTP
jgi:hypothetical protein